jgi:hypothetical protein
MRTIELSNVEEKHLRSILARHADDAHINLEGWVSLNLLLGKVNAGPRDFSEDSDYGLVADCIRPALDNPDPVPGFLLKSGACYVAAFGGWTDRMDCARVHNRERAERARKFHIEDLGHYGDIEIVPLEECE